MNTYTYKIGAFILALLMGATPAFAFAEKNGGEGVEGVRASTTLRAEINDAIEAAREDKTERRGEATTSDDLETSSERMTGRVLMLGRVNLLLEGSTTPALSLEQLRQSIEARRAELDDEEASSTSETREIVKNMNPMRLAVHALLASKELLGGIGPQVSEIARHMNDAVATSTSAEAKIQARGLFSRIFFGGDKASAESIDKASANIQENIQSLNNLLATATMTSEMNAVITAQITALTDAQTRLASLAEKERRQWGIFSWRF